MILACPVLRPSAGLATMKATAHGRGFQHPQRYADYRIMPRKRVKMLVSTWSSTG